MTRTMTLGPNDLYVLRLIHEHGFAGDATEQAVRTSLPIHLHENLTRLLQTGHLRIIGGHLSVEGRGVEALDWEVQAHGFQRHSRLPG